MMQPEFWNRWEIIVISPGTDSIISMSQSRLLSLALLISIGLCTLPFWGNGEPIRNCESFRGGSPWFQLQALFRWTEISNSFVTNFAWNLNPINICNVLLYVCCWNQNQSGVKIAHSENDATNGSKIGPLTPLAAKGLRQASIQPYKVIRRTCNNKNRCHAIN